MSFPIAHIFGSFLDGVGLESSTWQCWRSGTLQSTVCSALTSVQFRETLPNHSKQIHQAIMFSND